MNLYFFFFSPFSPHLISTRSQLYVFVTHICEKLSPLNNCRFGNKHFLEINVSVSAGLWCDIGLRIYVQRSFHFTGTRMPDVSSSTGVSYAYFNKLAPLSCCIWEPFFFFFFFFFVFCVGWIKMDFFLKKNSLA